MPSECLLIGRFEKMHDCVTNAHWTPLIWLELKQNEGVVWDVLESISIKKRNARGHLIFFPTASQVWIEPVEIFICFVSSIFWAIFGQNHSGYINNVYTMRILTVAYSGILWQCKGSAKAMQRQCKGSAKAVQRQC